jgi:hypothetical protein
VQGRRQDIHPEGNIQQANSKKIIFQSSRKKTQAKYEEMQNITENRKST